VLQRYQKIREKLKIEQSILRNRQESIARKASIDDPKQYDDNEQSPEDSRIFKM
jgi:hypothetical protein